MNSNVEVSETSLRITRVFQAPRPLVFSWWTQAEKLEQWSGCKETVSCRITMDFREGGSFTQEMVVAVNGSTCPFTFTGVYETIVVPEKIVYRANLGPCPTRVTVEFHEAGQATEVVLLHEGLPEQAARHVQQGTSESLDKLAAAIAAQNGGPGR